MKLRITALLLLAVLLLGGCGGTDISPGTYTDSSADTAPPPETSFSESTTAPVTQSAEKTEAVSTAAETHTEQTVTEKIIKTREELYEQEDTARFSGVLEEIYKKYEIIGMGVAVFCGDEVIYTGSLGYADRENKIPVTDNTKFRAASVSKIASTIILMELCDRGKLSTDSYLTDATGIEFDYPATEKMQLWHLLTHTAGLVDSWAYNDGVYYKYSVEKVLSKSHNGYAPGTVFNYCNFGSGTMGAVVESITGEFFHDFAKKALFDPLGMDAAYVADYLSDRTSCANVYDYDGEIFRVSQWGRTSEYYESFGLGNSYLSAQCELLISAADLARLGIILSNDGVTGGRRILSKKAVNDIHKEYFKTDDFSLGLNVRIYKGNLVDGRTIYGHPGNALGAVNGLYYDPSDGTGVAILTNRCSVFMNHDNGMYGMLDEVITQAYDCFFRRKE